MDWHAVFRALAAVALIAGAVAVYCAAIAAQEVRRAEQNADRQRRFRTAMNRISKTYN